MVAIDEVSDDGETPEPVENQETEEQRQEREARWNKWEEDEVVRVKKQFELADETRAEGGAFMKEEKYEDALDRYDCALVYLTKVGNAPDDRKKAERANLDLHNNIALAHIKLEQWDQAKDAADSAWLIDHQNVKALYRRAQAHAGKARESSLFSDQDAKAACEDLKTILKYDPKNVDANNFLRKLREEMKQHEQESLQKQKEVWGQVFGGKTNIEGEEDVKDDKPKPMIRLPTVGDMKDSKQANDRFNIMVCDQVSVGKGRPLLSGLDLKLPEKWCVGLYAKDGAEEKQALVDVLSCKQKPSSGTLEFPKRIRSGVNEDDVVHITTPVMLATVVGGVAILYALFTTNVPLLLSVMIGLIVVLALPLVVFMWYELQQQQKPPSVLHMTARGFERLKPAANETCLEVIIKSLPKKIPKLEKPEKAKALLKAADLEQQTQRLFNELADSEKQVVYMLTCLTNRVKVLVCDEPLRDLDISKQSRMLRMFKQMKQDCQTSFLYLSCDLQQLSLISDTLGMMGSNKLLELGPCQEVLTIPRSPEMKEVVTNSNMKNMMTSGLIEGSGSLQEFYNDMMKDSALAGMWLPKHVD